MHCEQSLLMLPPPSSVVYPHLPYVHQVMLTAKGALQLQRAPHPAASYHNAHSVPQALKGKKRRCRNAVKEPETSICRENSNHTARGSEEQHHQEEDPQLPQEKKEPTPSAGVPAGLVGLGKAEIAEEDIHFCYPDIAL